ncbi:MAG: hypothetical protein R2862_04035 [Thermoanaerobaculia bacterium]
MSLNIAHARRKSQHQSLLRETTIRRNLELIAGVIQREEPQVVASSEADGPSSWSGSSTTSACSRSRRLPALVPRRAQSAGAGALRRLLRYGAALPAAARRPALARLPAELARHEGVRRSDDRPRSARRRERRRVSIHLDFSPTGCDDSRSNSSSKRSAITDDI